MDGHHFELLVRARGLAETKALIERAIETLATEAAAAGVCRTDLADALGIDRATLYRRYLTGTDLIHSPEANRSAAEGGSFERCASSPTGLVICGG